MLGKRSSVGSCFHNMGPILECPERFSHLESCSKKLMITALFYSCIFNMNRGSLHTRIHHSVFRYRLTKNGYTDPKHFLGFLETGAISCFYIETGKAKLFFCLTSSWTYFILQCIYYYSRSYYCTVVVPLISAGCIDRSLMCHP